MSIDISVWIGFFTLIIGILVLDLGVFHRKDHEIKIKEAFIWTVVWISLALVFNLFLYLWQGQEMALQFLTGYLIEKSLSVDNIFVFSVVFAYFHVPKAYLHRVLFWGILSALIMRGIMIAIGVALITRFQWITYIFGVFLIITAIKLLFERKGGEHLDQRFLVRLFRKMIPFSPHFHGNAFFIKENGWKATPLFLTLLVLEISDLVFAIDSIPAIFALTQEPFIIYTLNIFAILGLRSLYFVLANVLGRFYYLKFGLSAILGFVGLKMLLAHLYKIPIGISLSIILLILITSIFFSILFPPKKLKSFF